MNRLIVWGLALLSCALGSALADELHLRDGARLVGRIEAESETSYRFRLALTQDAVVTNISRTRVRYVVYSSPQRARDHLEVDETTRLLGAQQEARITVLPTDPFGSALLDVVRGARERIWITAYYISGSIDPAIQGLYDELQAKARGGVDVRILAEDSRRTPPSIRRASMNFAETLRASGIQVAYLRNQRVLHKKIVLIDRNKVVLGSSNLTAAGLAYSDEMNILVESHAFAREVEQDFRRMEKGASREVVQ